MLTLDGLYLSRVIFNFSDTSILAKSTVDFSWNKAHTLWTIQFQITYSVTQSGREAFVNKSNLLVLMRLAWKRTII